MPLSRVANELAISPFYCKNILFFLVSEISFEKKKFNDLSNRINNEIRKFELLHRQPWVKSEGRNSGSDDSGDISWQYNTAQHNTALN